MRRRYFLLIQQFTIITQSAISFTCHGDPLQSVKRSPPKQQQSRGSRFEHSTGTSEEWSGHRRARRTGYGSALFYASLGERLAAFRGTGHCRRPARWNRRGVDDGREERARQRFRPRTRSADGHPLERRQARHARAAQRRHLPIPARRQQTGQRRVQVPRIRRHRVLTRSRGYDHHRGRTEFAAIRGK